MKSIGLYNMIKYIENGTNLHIGVLFFGSYGNKMCEVPYSHLIHTAPICENLKNRSKSEYKRCFRCRNLALKKALISKKPFGGLCINGIYEYTHPVIINDEVACVIFVGNILQEDGYNKLCMKTSHDAQLINTTESKLKNDDIVTISKILENHIIFLLEKFSYDNDGLNPLIENIKSYINSNIEFNIDIGRIAEQFHYNKTYLCRLFKKEAGMNIKDYINFQRIEKSKLLLENTNETVIEIVNKIGFNNVTYFNKVFRCYVNMSPTQYRRLKKQG